MTPDPAPAPAPVPSAAPPDSAPSAAPPDPVDHELGVMINASGRPETHDQRGVWGRVRHLPVQLAVFGALFVAGAVVGLASAGASGAVGVVAGLALVAASYTATTIAVAWADSVNPRLVLGVGMAVYVTKFSLFGAMLIAVGGTDWAGKIPMAMGIVAGVVAWTGTQIWWTVRPPRSGLIMSFGPPKRVDHDP